MKKILYLSIPMLLLASCNDDFGKDKENKPVPTPGEDVEFTCASGDDAVSRTIYADEDTTVNGKTAWRIYWLDGDKINVFTPQGPTGFQLAPYQVVNKRDPKPGTQEEGPQPVDYLNYALQLNKVNEYGVRWGNQSTQDFYAVYPYTTATNQISNTGTVDNPDVTITANVEANQINSAPFYSSTNGTSVFVKGDMENNIMWAHKKENNGAQYVDLRFHAATTVIQFQFNGLETNVISGGTTTTTQEPMNIQKVTLTSKDGSNINIAGTLNIKVGADETATYTVTDGSTSVSVEPRYNNAYVTMPAGGSCTVNLFLAIPSGTSYDLTDWVISVKGDKGTFTKKLSAKEANMAKTITPGSINLINLPKFTYNGDWTYNLDSWMADIPDNVYFTEVSMPGSWYSGRSSSTTGEYQDKTIEQQFANGVRAFYLETRVSTNRDPVTAGNYPDAMSRNTDTGILALYSFVGISGTGNNLDGTGYNFSAINAYNGATKLTSVVESIIDQVRKVPTGQTKATEFAVLTLSYSDGGESGVTPIWRCRWVEKLQYFLNTELPASYRSAIFTGPITANTTVSELRGKLIIKINLDADSELSNVDEFKAGGISGNTSFSYNGWNTNFCANINALFSYASYDWTNLSGGLSSRMLWKSKPTVPLTGEAPTSSGMYCAYTVANRTLTNQGLHPSTQDRKDAIAALIEQSANLRNQGEHNVFFMIGAGGTRAATSTTTQTESGGATKVACTLTPYIQSQIENKINNNQPSPLGCVFINFVGSTVTGQDADGTTVTVDGKKFVNTVIEMNNKFYLKRAEETSPQSIQSKAPGYSSGMTDNNVNAIDWTATK